MKTNHQELFHYLTPAEPRPDLVDRVMARIHREKQTALVKVKIRFALLSLVAVFTLGFFVPVWNWFLTDTAQTGFSQFLSLLFSDFRTVLSEWQNFTLVLLESLPFLSLTVVLIVVFVFLFTLQFLIRDIKRVFHSRPIFPLAHNLYL